MSVLTQAMIPGLRCSPLAMCATVLAAASLRGQAPGDGEPARDSARCVIENRRVRLVKSPELDSISPTLLSYPPVPAPYADTRAWFVSQKGLILRGRRMQFHALPVVLLPAERMRFLEYDGVTLYMDPEAAREPFPPIVYAPISSGCEFQPYYYFDESEPVRGK